jgi:hypothetical protein
MIIIGNTTLHIDVPALPRDEFERYSVELFDSWENHVSEVLNLPDYSLILEAEEGSVSVKARVLTALGVFYVGIAQYGSFISGLQVIQNQTRTASEYLANKASVPFGVRPKVTHRGGALARIQTTFVKVKRGEITVEEAMTEAESIFGSELGDASEFQRYLKNFIDELPLDPQQTELELVDGEGEPLLPIPRKRMASLPKPRNPMPDPDQYRVEIWRDSRRAERNVRVTKID